ncbi:MAG: helix-turn-helix transcriptional regulator [Pseudomonadota bacterium]
MSTEDSRIMEHSALIGLEAGVSDQSFGKIEQVPSERNGESGKTGGTFSGRLRAARKASGLTFGGLAEKAGISKTHVWELCRGRVNNPTISLTEKLADALDCDAAWLAGWGENEALERALDRMGWPEIHAFQRELARGQDVYEDAGGYFMRAIKALFGLPGKDPVVTYREAARAMIAQANGGAA